MGAVLLYAGGETTSGEVPCRRMVRDLLWSGQPGGSQRRPGRRGSGTSLSSFRGRMSAHRGSRCVSRLGPETGPGSFSAGFPSDPEMTRGGCAKRRGARSSVPRTKLAARLAGCSQRCAASSLGPAGAPPPRGLIAPLSLPRSGPGPRQPWARDQLYELLSIRPSSWPRARLRSIAQRELGMRAVMPVAVTFCLLPRADHGPAERSERA